MKINKNYLRNLNTPDYKKFIVLVLFVFLIFIVSLIIGISLDKVSLIKEIDKSVYALFRNIPHTKLMNSLVQPFNNNFLPLFRPHPSFLIVIYGAFLIYLYLFKRNLIIWAIIALFIATLIARIILHIDTSIFFRERPYEHLPNDVLPAVKEGLKNWTSYPSGHTRDAAIYITIIAFFIKKYYIFLALIVVFVGFSRLYLGIHYFSDVLMGAAIGGAIGYVTIEIVRQLQKIFLNKKLV